MGKLGIQTRRDSSFCGNQETGLSACYVRRSSHSDNNFSQLKDPHSPQIVISGSGGRQQNPTTKTYEQAYDQFLGRNIAPITNAVLTIPLRLCVEIADQHSVPRAQRKYEYLGLWMVIDTALNHRGTSMSFCWDCFFSN